MGEDTLGCLHQVLSEAQQSKQSTVSLHIVYRLHGFNATLQDSHSRHVPERKNSKLDNPSLEREALHL